MKRLLIAIGVAGLLLSLLTLVVAPANAECRSKGHNHSDNFGHENDGPPFGSIGPVTWRLHTNEVWTDTCSHGSLTVGILFTTDGINVQGGTPHVDYVEYQDNLGYHKIKTHDSPTATNGPPSSWSIRYVMPHVDLAPGVRITRIKVHYHISFGDKDGAEGLSLHEHTKVIKLPKSCRPHFCGNISLP